MRTFGILSISALALLALTACGGNKSSSASSTSAAGQSAATTAPAEASIPNCGAVSAVWVNLNTKVYHEPSDPMYGKTKHGEYLCPSQAVAQGFHAAGGGAKHHKGQAKGGDSSM